MNVTLEKVTVFITREKGNQIDLLLIQHPFAGIQLPAGTVDEGENHSVAAIREAREETGLSVFKDVRYIGHMEQDLPQGQLIVSKTTKVYSRPDPTSFAWAEFRRGIPVARIREEIGFYQVSYMEYDQVPSSKYVSYNITGWVQSDCVAAKVRRHFYHLTVEDSANETWEHFSDNHRFRLFWAPLNNLPDIISPQDQWLSFVRMEHLAGDSDVNAL